MVVSRRGAPLRAPRRVSDCTLRASHCHRRLRRRDGKAAGGLSVDLVFADPPYSLQLENDFYRPNMSKWTRSTTTGTNSAGFAEYDDFTGAWLPACRRVLKLGRHGLGDRLVPQHFPRRRDHAGSRLLDPQRRHLAQDQPDAEFPRPPLHQCARDADLGVARPGAKGYTFNHEVLKAGNEDVQVRSDWASRCAPARSA